MLGPGFHPHQKVGSGGRPGHLRHTQKAGNTNSIKQKTSVYEVEEHHEKIANASQNRNTFISYIPHKHPRSRYILQIDNRKNNPAFKEYKDLEIFPPEDIQVAIERKINPHHIQL